MSGLVHNLAAAKMTDPVTAYVGVGSNLQNPKAQVAKAMDAIGLLDRVRLIARSNLYRSAAVGPPGQPDYVNAVVKVETRLSAPDLLAALLALEAQLGRVRGGERWGPRIIDLDLLLYADQCHDSERLSLPHPQIPFRPFVLVPLRDVAGSDLQIPGRGRLDDLIKGIDVSQLQRVDYN